MESPEFVQSKLKLRLHAASVSQEVVDGERIQYRLHFNEDIGIDWLVSELDKAFAELDVGLQKWEIEPAGCGGFCVTVRETVRRPDLESDQESLHKWEQN